MNSLVKNVFTIIAGVLLASLLYIIFFVGENSAIATVCRAVEKPVAKYYYDVALYPSVHVDEGLAASLGVTVYAGSDYSGSTSKDNASTEAGYSTGWFDGEDVHSKSNRYSSSDRDL